MKYCPLTLDPLDELECYSKRGLRQLAPNLKSLAPLELSTLALRREAIERAGKMSVQGVQTKLSAQLKIQAGRLEIVSTGGTYILKPESEAYREVPANEALTMTLASIAGIDVPAHGLVPDLDGQHVYFVKRFDRLTHNKKRALEDFSQLLGFDRDTKYDASMEKLVDCLDYSTAPLIDASKLFRVVLFNFLVGNEDAHLKNFSLLTDGNRVMLSPAYDLLNSSITIQTPIEEFALPLAGKKSKLKRHDLVDYFGRERLKLGDKLIAKTLDDLENSIATFNDYIERSFLSEEMKGRYSTLLSDRKKRLFGG